MNEKIVNPNDKERLQKTADLLVGILVEKGKTYGDSWKKRGGVGAAMMLLRKLDRVENILNTQGYDVFKALETSMDWEMDLEDDIRDVAGYSILILTEWEDLLNRIIQARNNPKPKKDPNQLELSLDC